MQGVSQSPRKKCVRKILISELAQKSLKEFIENKDNFVDYGIDKTDEYIGHILTGMPKCLAHLLQRSEEYINQEYDETTMNTVIKTKKDGTKVTVRDKINKHKKYK